MSDADDIERCPVHPDAEPVLVVVNEIRGAQSGYPTRLVQQARCPICC